MHLSGEEFREQRVARDLTASEAMTDLSVRSIVYLSKEACRDKEMLQVNWLRSQSKNLYGFLFSRKARINDKAAAFDAME